MDNNRLTDLVARLNDAAKEEAHYGDRHGDGKIFKEAAAAIEELMAALKPFAEMLLSYHAPMHDGRSSEVSPLVGELRRARAALKEDE